MTPIEPTKELKDVLRACFMNYMSRDGALLLFWNYGFEVTIDADPGGGYRVATSERDGAAPRRFFPSWRARSQGQVAAWIWDYWKER